MALLHGFGLVAAGDLRGWLSGSLSLAMLLALFVTGWWRPHWVRRWGTAAWRWVHWLLAAGSLLLGVEHWLLVERAKGLA